MLPGSGPFSRLSMVTGINHYIHFLKPESVSFSRKGGLIFDVDNLVSAIKYSIDKIENVVESRFSDL